MERGMITSTEEEGHDYNKGSYTYTAYTIQPEGMKWMIRNCERLNLKTAEQSAKERFINDLDDDPDPFPLLPPAT